MTGTHIIHIETCHLLKYCQIIFCNSSQESLAKINVLEVELQKLMELTAVLNQRLENERMLHSETQLNHRKERQRAAKLETKLMRLEMESNLFKPQNYSTKAPKNSVATVDTEESNTVLVESYKNK